MVVRVIRLGSDRATGEGTRIGTVRRPPRGVRKADLAKDNWYDVWFPNLAPSAETVKLAQSATTPVQWRVFERRYRREMAEPAAAREITLLAALSQHADFSVGCYCEDASRCHRSILGELLRKSGARIAR